MRRYIPVLLFCLSLFTTASGQVITIDYMQADADKLTRLDFTSDVDIQLIHIPAPLPNAININDAGTVNITINATRLTAYGQAFARGTLTVHFSQGKITAPFATDNIQDGLVFTFNGKTFTIKPQQPVNDPAGAGRPGGGGATGIAKPFLKKIPVQDAVTMASSSTNQDYTYRKIIEYYCYTLHGNAMPAITPSRTPDLDKATFITIMKTIDNEFLNDQSVYDKLFFGVSRAGAEGGSIGAVGQAIGGLNVTTFADGFAQFLVKRVKAELGTAFFDRFRTVLQDKQYADARTLFPNTYAMLNAIGSQIYQYNAYLSGLRAAFIKDLNALLQNLPKVITDGQHKDFFDAHPFLEFTCLEGLDIANGLMQGKHIGKIIEDLPPNYFTNLSQNATQGYNQDALKNVSGILQTFQLLSGSLKSLNPDQYWIGADTLKLMNDNTTLRIYLGLLYEEVKQNDIVFGQGQSLKLLLDDVAANFTEYVTDYQNFFTSLVKQAILIENDIHQSSGKKADSVMFDNYYRYFNETLDLFSYAANIGNLKGLTAIKPDSTFERYIEVGRNMANLALDVNKKNYASAILDACTAYNFAFANTGAFSGGLLKYGIFIATVAQAKTADEVTQAIEAAALPQGSSRIKRESRFNVALNAYVGLYGGYEKYIGDNNNWLFPKINAFGVTAPLGVSISLGKLHAVNPFCGTGHASYTLFISLIDLGALASFRFGDSTSAAPNIQFKDIVSPGAFLSVGIPKTPLSVNAGVQLGPNLRSITHSSTTAMPNDDTKAYLRVSFSICVDIPVINFYTNGGN